MKRFFYTEYIVRASGYQRGYVEAETLEDAKRGMKDGTLERIFDDEDIEVTELGPTQWDDEEG